MTTVLLLTRPDFEPWYLVPSFSLWGSGHAIIIKLGRRQVSSKMAALKEELEMERLRAEHRKKMTFSWTERHLGVTAIVVIVAFITGFWFLANGLDGIRELLEVFGCGCEK